MQAKVAERGQVTIPLELRKKLGIGPGTILEFRVSHSKLVVTKSSTKDPVTEVYGCLKNIKKSTDEIIDELRGQP